MFAETCKDAAKILDVIRGVDLKDSYSRAAQPGDDATPWATSAFNFGVPDDSSLEFFGDRLSQASYSRAIDALTSLGGTAVRFDFSPFRAAAGLLYGGPWVAERLAALKDFVATHQEDMDPTVAQIMSGGARFSAVDTFVAEYELKALRQKTDAVYDKVDFLLLPTVATAYKIGQLLQSPVELNSNLGYYTNFVNLLDLAAVAVPAGIRDDGLPFGVSLIGKAFSDEGLLRVADKVHRGLAITLGGTERLLAKTPLMPVEAAPKGCVLMAVVGAHLSGEPLNWQLVTRKARLMRTIRTHSDYRLYVLPNSIPPKPGLVYWPGHGGTGIELEVWAMPEDTVGSFLNGIPAPLCLGTVRLEDGSNVKGFLCESAGVTEALEITHLGGWSLSHIHWTGVKAILSARSLLLREQS